MTEIPWFTEPPDAKLARGNHIDDDLAYLHFIGPDGERAVIWVTEGETTQRHGQNVWHIEVAGDVATVSPSVHFVGHWHSPNPVKFRLVEELSTDDG